MTRLFEEAVESYRRQGGESRYLDKITRLLRGRDVQTITPAEVRQVALDVYPEAKNSTRNRCIVTPVRAVLYHAHDLGWRGPSRIRGFKAERSVKHQPVNGVWVSQFINQCERDGLHRLAALVLFMQHTGARISEAVRLRGDNVDLMRRIAILEKTKTGVMERAYLTDELVFRMHSLNLTDGQLVFGYKSRHSVNERMVAVCRRAGIVYSPPHSVGRHTFATNALKGGCNVKTVMDAGRWRSSVIFLEVYAHTEQAGRDVADLFNRQRYMSY